MGSVNKTALELLFDVRKEHYEDITSSIMVQVSEVTGGVDEFFASLPIFEHATIDWINIEVNPKMVEAERVGFYGVMSYTIGGTFTTSKGEVIPITEENAAYFDRPIQLRLPLELVAANIRQDVIDYLQTRAGEFGHEHDENEIKTEEEQPKQEKKTEPPFPGPVAPNLFPGELDEREQKRILLTAKNPEGKFH